MDPFVIASDSSFSDGETASKKHHTDTVHRISTKNIYDLDEFSDDNIILPSLEMRIKTKQNSNIDILKPKVDCIANESSATAISNPAWGEKFSTEDFCENSNDFNAILKRISQLEEKNSEPVVDKENTPRIDFENLIYGEIIDKPITKNQYYDPLVDSSDTSNSFTLTKSNSFKKSGLTETRSEENLKSEKELRKEVRLQERERKKQEKENQKQLKGSLKIINNCIKPTKCLEYITVNIDENLAQSNHGKAIIAGLEDGGCNFKETKAIVKNIISWTRKVPTLEYTVVKNLFQEEKHYLLVMDAQELLEHISNDTLVSCIQSLTSLPVINHLSIAIYGLTEYYKYLKQLYQQNPQPSTSKNLKRKYQCRKFENLSKHITKNDIDMKLIELQIFCKNIFIRHIETNVQLARFVQECTKSVAQIPFKLNRECSLSDENEYFSSITKASVRVDKDGNGLSGLWKQFLKMFPLASLETAEAVSSVYPTLTSLMNAYKQCASNNEGEKLLEDLLVRRAIGEFSGQRRIGPAFSKKAFQFFCSNNNSML